MQQDRRHSPGRQIHQQARVGHIDRGTLGLSLFARDDQLPSADQRPPIGWRVAGGVGADPARVGRRVDSGSRSRGRRNWRLRWRHSAPITDAVTDESITIQIGNVAEIPEPASLALFGIGACMAGLGAASRRQRTFQHLQC
jgi:hypothetical protein